MIENKLLVSVIIVSRNSKGTLRRCIDSIFKQTYRDIEIVVVDSSDDGTDKIIEEYKRKSEVPFRVIYQEPRGVGIARNTAIETAKGEVLLYVDADCYIPPEYIEKAIKPFIESDKTLTVFTDMEISSASPSFFGNLVSLYEKIMPNISHILTTHLVRKKLYDLIGKYDGNLKSGEDSELLNRLLKVRNNLEQKGYRFAAVYDAIYYEIKQETSIREYYKKCIWYGKPLANRNYFFSDLKSNIIKLFFITYLSIFPLITILMLIKEFEFLNLLIFLIPFIMLFVYTTYKSIIKRSLSFYVLLLPFLMIYKSIGLLIGFMLGLSERI